MMSTVATTRRQPRTMRSVQQTLQVKKRMMESRNGGNGDEKNQKENITQVLPNMNLKNLKDRTSLAPVVVIVMMKKDTTKENVSHSSFFPGVRTLTFVL